jgi:hypothetical protein
MFHPAVVLFACSSVCIIKEVLLVESTLPKLPTQVYSEAKNARQSSDLFGLLSITLIVEIRSVYRVWRLAPFGTTRICTRTSVDLVGA